MMPDEPSNSNSRSDEAGDAAAGDRLSTQLYSELRRLAARELRRERPAHTLQATALVHEAWLRLNRSSDSAGLAKSEFMCRAAHAVRQVLVEHARRRARARRGGAWRRITLTQESLESEGGELDLLDLEEALHRLSALHPRQAAVVELRFFGGVSVDEAANALEVAPRTIDGDWKVARAWLARELGHHRAE